MLALEHDVTARCVGLGVDGARTLRRLSIGVHAYVGQISAQLCLHCSLHRWVEGLPSTCDDLPDQ
jgi:hypothetical protein